MGKDLVVGLQGGDSKLITFRLVKVQNTLNITSLGGNVYGFVGYIVSENKVFASNGLGVRIARQ